MTDNPWAGRPGTWTGPPVESAAPIDKGPALAWPSKAPAVAAATPSAGGEAKAADGELRAPSAAAVSSESAAAAEPHAVPAEGSGHAAATDASQYQRFSAWSAPLVDKFNAEVHQAPAELVAHSQAWLFDLARGAINLDKVPPRAHAYNFDLSTVRGVRGRAEATSFLNMAAANGISEPDALRAIGWIRDANRRGGIAALFKAPPKPAGAPAARSASAEIAAIEQRMRTDRRGYLRDNTMQARYRELLEARGA